MKMKEEKKRKKKVLVEKDILNKHSNKMK